MRKTAIALAVLGLVACGGGDDDDRPTPEPAPADDATAADDNGDDGNGDDVEDGGAGGGAIVNPQPAGQASVTIEGLDYTMQEPGALDCTISDDAITFSFRIGDNEVTLGAGANLYDTGWLGNIEVRVANPPSEPGPIIYYPDLTANGDRLVIDGSSASYAGPMKKQPANDGSNPPPVDVGDGTISVTCP